jgi:hypothetical protein
MVLKSNVEITVSGSIDVNVLFTAFITVISVIMGWLFGRQERAG